MTALFNTDDVQAALDQVGALDRADLERVAVEAGAMAVLWRDTASGYGEERRELLKDRIRLSQKTRKGAEVQLKRAQSSVEYFTRALATIDADIEALQFDLHNT